MRLPSRRALLATATLLVAATVGCPKPEEGPPATAAPPPEFPWPPPTPSAFYTVPRDSIPSPHATFQDVSTNLVRALEGAGYFESRFFSVPDGFALVTRSELINRDGTSKASEERWGGSAMRSLWAVIEGILRGNPGHYRILVFVATSEPFVHDTARVSLQTASTWLEEGINQLPPEFAARRFTRDHRITALIYEFEQVSLDSAAPLKKPSPLQGREHLERAHLLAGLFGR